MSLQYIKKATSLLYRYNGILKEVIAQKSLYSSESEFMAQWCKYAILVNYLQGFLLKYS